MEGENSGHHLTPAQIHQLMSVIAGMETVKEAGAGESSPPPTDEEIQQFLDYVGMGVVNAQRMEYEEERQNVPEPPRRNKQACQYFWRRHYLSIIQEDEEEHNEATPGPSRTASRPGSTYENNLSRLSRVIGALSPVSVNNNNDKEIRGSWGSEMSMESMTSINSILSEEGSETSNGSFESNDRSLNLSENNESNRDTVMGRKAPQLLSSLLESVHPPSNTPDSMLSAAESQSSIRLSKADSDNEDSSVLNIAKFRMGSKFKQSIQHIEELKQKGKREFKELSDKVFPKDLNSKCQTSMNNNNIQTFKTLTNSNNTVSNTTIAQYDPPSTNNTEVLSLNNVDKVISI